MDPLKPAIEPGPQPTRPAPTGLRLLKASWRSWVSTELYPAGPVWLQWLWTLLFCVGLAVLFALLGLAVDGVPWWRGFRVNLVVSMTIGVLIHLLFLAVMKGWGRERIQALPPRRRALLFSGVPTLGVLLGWPAGVWLVSEFGLGWMRLNTGTLIGSAALGLLLSFFIYLYFSAKARQATAEKQAIEAQLRLLQGQIEPHFLFNTLANVIGQIDDDPARARLTLERFTDYLRGSLGRLRAGDTTLGAELDLVDAYLAVLQMRMEDRLHYQVQVQPELRGLALPPLLLQPLVENAIHHGLEPQVQGGTVSVNAARDGEHLVLTVHDDGRGLHTARRPSRGAGVALNNLRERLASRYGGQASLVLEAAEPGTRATLRLPLAIDPPSPSNTPRP